VTERERSPRATGAFASGASATTESGGKRRRRLGQVVAATREASHSGVAAMICGSAGEPLKRIAALHWESW
jgi:hypothetical protein